MTRLAGILLIALAPTLEAQVLRVAPIATPPWRKVIAESAYRAEGANVGDFDKDGVLDLVYGAFWYRGPDFRTKTRIHPGAKFPIGGYSDRFFAFVDDFDGDTWPDVLTVGFPGQAAKWYRNPGTQSGAWRETVAHTQVGTESPAFVDVDRDGVRELVCATNGYLVRVVPDRKKPFQPWNAIRLHDAKIWSTFTHGLGVGDVNGDGRLDVLTRGGWLEQPKNLTGNPSWLAHAYLFTPFGGAQMHCADLDGDGDADVISSYHAHAWGLAWYEQIRSNGKITFRPHEILPPVAPKPGALRLSQLHAVAVADFDGDGISDIATGKTFWAHNGIDPGARDPAELWIFRTKRTGTGVRFVPQLVDGSSGVGRQLVVRDVNRDGKPDLIVGNKKGASVHIRQ